MMPRNESGQVGLIILLIMVVVLTVGVSVAQRTVTQMRIQEQEEVSSKAFNVAETGIEEALSRDLILNPGETEQSTDSINGVDMNWSVEASSEYSGRVEEGHVAQVNLEGLTSGNLTVSWNPSSCSAVVVALLYNTGMVRRYAYAPSSCAGDFPNFTTVSGSPASASVPIANPSLAGGVQASMARIKVVGATTSLTVSGASNKTQSYTIESVAKDEQGGETRAIQVSKTIPSVASIFDYVLFSGSGISQAP